METAEIGDEKIAAQSIAGTDPQLTGKISFSGKDSLSLVEHGKGRLYMLEEKLSLRSQDDPFWYCAQTKYGPAFFSRF